MPSNQNNASIDIVFDHLTTYRLWSPVKAQPSLTVKITRGQIRHDEELDFKVPLPDKQVFHAVPHMHESQNLSPFAHANLAVKWARGKKGVDRLRYEAVIYQDFLGGLQGTVVPQFFGFYTTTVDRVEVGCLLLEWCQKYPEAKYHPDLDPDEFNARQMPAICRLHETHIIHGNLMDARHFLMDSKGKMRIVDFSAAKLHLCDGPKACRELYEMGILFRMRGRTP